MKTIEKIKSMNDHDRLLVLLLITVINEPDVIQAIELFELKPAFVKGDD